MDRLSQFNHYQPYANPYPPIGRSSMAPAFPNIAPFQQNVQDTFQTTDSPPSNPQPIETPWYATLAKEALKIGIMVGGSIVGGLLAGPPGAIAGGAITSGIVSAGDQLLTKGQIDLGTVTIDTFIGAIPGGIGATFSKVGGKVFSVLGKTMVKAVTQSAVDGGVIGYVSGFSHQAYDNYKTTGDVDLGKANTAGLSSVLPGLFGGAILGGGAYAAAKHFSGIPGKMPSQPAEVVKTPVPEKTPVTAEPKTLKQSSTTPPPSNLERPPVVPLKEQSVSPIVAVAPLPAVHESFTAKPSEPVIAEVIPEIPVLAPEKPLPTITQLTAPANQLVSETELQNLMAKYETAYDLKGEPIFAPKLEKVYEHDLEALDFLKEDNSPMARDPQTIVTPISPEDLQKTYYHGSPQLSKVQQEGFSLDINHYTARQFGRGVYLAETPQFAKHYGDVGAFELNLKKVGVADQGVCEAYLRLIDESLYQFGKTNKLTAAQRKILQNEIYRRYFTSQGYDAVLFKHRSNPTLNMLVAYEPQNILASQLPKF